MPEKCTDNPRDCPLVPRIEALEEAIDDNKRAHKEFYGKLEKHETASAVFAERLEQIKEDTTEIKKSLQGAQNDVQEIREKPAKRWDGLVDKLLFTAVGAFLMWLASGMPGVGS